MALHKQFRGGAIMRLTFVITAFWLILVGTAGAGDVRAAIREPTAIPAQSLGSALQTLAKDRDFQLICRADLVAGLRTSGISGQLTSSEALGELLRGTGLTYRYLDERTVTIEAQSPRPEGAGPTRPSNGPPADTSTTAGTKEGKRGSSRQFRMAQAHRRAPEGPAAVNLGSRRPRSQSAASLDEVIVTAQKLRQRAIDVPISLAVIGSTDLQRLVVRNLSDLASYVPGLTVESTGNSLFVSIRGVSNLAGTGAVVGSYLDEADVTTDDTEGINLSAYDLARVEVLRGPQGTLYGEGSVGGTIRYITNRPVLTEFQMTSHVTALFDQYGAPGDRVEAAVNTPVVQNVLGLRFAVYLDHEGGWVDQPAANAKNINGTNLTDARVEGRWEPASDLTIYATEVTHTATSGPSTGEDANGNYTQAFNLTTTPVFHDRYDISNVTVEWDPAYARVLNSATYFKHDSGGLNQGYVGYQFTPPPSPTLDFYTSARSIDESVSDELRVSDTGRGPWRWTLGTFFRRFTDYLPPTLGYFGLHGPPGTPLPAPFSATSDLRAKSWSGFGDTNYHLFGRLVFGAGVRYFRDDESALVSGASQWQAKTFTSVDPRFYIRYGLSRDVNVYASAAKGFRSGGFNGLGAPEYQPEHVWTYELGTKARVLDGRLTADADIFLSNYGEYQIYGVALPPNPPLDLYRNAGTARIKGVEGDVTWRPADHWLLGLSGDYINARFVKINAVATSYEVGDPMDLTPRFQVTASVERDFDWAGKEAYARVEYSQRARETFRNRNTGFWYYSQSDYIYLLNFNSGIDVSQNLGLGLFVQNILNDRGYTAADVIEDSAAREEPRTFGLEFNFKF